jgi:hypothetical protein
MSDRPTPPPAPPRNNSPGRAREKQAPVADKRAEFARKVPQTAEEGARTNAFIAGKMDMIRADRNMSEAEKAAAIADLERRLRE